jgi:hypothetical protein
MKQKTEKYQVDNFVGRIKPLGTKQKTKKEEAQRGIRRQRDCRIELFG